MDEDDYIRRYASFWRRVIIPVAVIIAVPVMMWTITIFIRSYVGPKTPTFGHLTLTEPLPPRPQAAQRAPAPLLTDAARTAGGGPASLPDPNSGFLKGPLALPQGMRRLPPPLQQGLPRLHRTHQPLRQEKRPPSPIVRSRQQRPKPRRARR